MKFWDVSSNPWPASQFVFHRWTHGAHLCIQVFVYIMFIIPTSTYQYYPTHWSPIKRYTSLIDCQLTFKYKFQKTRCTVIMRHITDAKGWRSDFLHKFKYLDTDFNFYCITRGFRGGCNKCGVPAGNIYTSRFLVPSVGWGLAWDHFPQMSRDCLDYSTSKAVYCFICDRRRVAVARYRKICLVLWISLGTFSILQN